MLDFTEQRRLIESEISNNFSLCPVLFENVGVPPENDVPAWVSVVDKASFSDQTGFGEPSFLTGGAIILAIFVPKGSGTALARTIAKNLADILASKEIGGISLHQPEFHGSPGIDKDNPWYQMNLIIPYTAIMGQTISC